MYVAQGSEGYVRKKKQPEEEAMRSKGPEVQRTPTSDVPSNPEKPELVSQPQTNFVLARTGRRTRGKGSRAPERRPVNPFPAADCSSNAMEVAAQTKAIAQ